MDIKLFFNTTGFRLEFTPYLIRGRNDEKGGRLKFVSPAKAGVQSRGFKLPDPQIDNVYLIMDSLVNPS
jgi:hypothetical protein